MRSPRATGARSLPGSRAPFLLGDGASSRAARVRRTLTALSFTLLSAACSPAPVELREGTREYVADDYRSVLRKWTRDSQLTTLDAMDNVLTVTSTYESWDFRWAYAARYAEDYRLTIEERKKFLDRSLEESREHHRFYVTLYAQHHKWGDLKLDEPAWILRLVDDAGTETAPIDIQPIRRPSALERTYFPYTTTWRSAYRITFPRTTEEGRSSIRKKAHWFGLRFAGAQGNTTLVWELEPSHDEDAKHQRTVAR